MIGLSGDALIDSKDKHFLFCLSHSAASMCTQDICLTEQEREREGERMSDSGNDIRYAYVCVWVGGWK